MVLIKMLRKIKKELKKHQKIVRIQNYTFYINKYYFLVNDIVEEEIKNGIPPERVVSHFDF